MLCGFHARNVMFLAWENVTPGRTHGRIMLSRGWKKGRVGWSAYWWCERGLHYPKRSGNDKMPVVVGEEKRFFPNELHRKAVLFIFFLLFLLIAGYLCFHPGLASYVS